MKTQLYRHFNSAGNLLYVGISLSAVQRLGQHAEHSAWFASITRVDIKSFETREAALEAERKAIIEERPLHNIHHKKAADQAVRRALEEKTEQLSAAAQSKKDLTLRIAHFSPVYTIKEAAHALSVDTRLVMKWIREGAIGHFTMPSRTGKPVPFISGWQLIEHIDTMVALSSSQPR